MRINDLFQWLSGRPVWQQDAVRRICEHGRLTDADLEALQKQIEALQGLTTPDPKPLPPFTNDHLIDRSAAVPRTILGSVGPLRNVDRLATGQNPLRLAKTGVTLIVPRRGLKPSPSGEGKGR